MEFRGTELDPVGTDADGTARDRPARPAIGMRRQKLATETLRLYASDWARFAAFCAGIGASALPGAPDTVVAFLQAPGLGPQARSRRLAAIDHRHRQFSFGRPGDDPQVRRALKTAKKSTPRRRRPAPPAAASLHAMAMRCRRDLAGLRDRALLLLLAQGLSRRAVVGLHAENLHCAEDGVRVDTEKKLIARGARHDLCPVRALEDWLRASAIRYGPVFRKVTRWGTIEPGPLGADAVRRILARFSS